MPTLGARDDRLLHQEIGLEAGVPTYAGGLGILAGDTVRSAADLRLPLVSWWVAKP